LSYRGYILGLSSKEMTEGMGKILAALLLVGGTGALYAAPVYSCGGGSACNGNLYAVWVVSQTASSYVLDVGILVRNDYLSTDGGPGSNSDFISALSIIPDNSGTMTSASLTGHPAGIWNLQSGGLNSGGCSGSGAPYICAGANGMGANLFNYNSGSYTPNSPLIWQFTINGTPPSLGDTAHIKYLYISNLGTKVGDLGSFDVAIQCIGGGPCEDSPTGGVPEPTTSALIGGGLIGLYFIRRHLPV
jgi:PEP-CTERM motif